MNERDAPLARLHHELVICTRNRADDLALALRTASEQTLQPQVVTVVDASDDGDSKEVVLRWAEVAAERGVRVRWLPAAPGLPAQRNLAARSSTADVLHFVDDDVELDPRYLQELAAVLEGDDRVVGAGGLIVNQEPNRPRIWWRLAMMDSNRRGTVLPSGVATIIVTSSEPRSTRWLSGCSMSYRTEVVREIGFDESLAGYALMEDVDFGYRASQRGTLIHQPRARLRHNVSPVERWDHRERARAAVYRRGWFVKKNLPRWAMFWFWWSVLAGTVVQVAVSLVERRRWGLRVAGWTVHGAVDYLRGVR